VTRAECEERIGRKTFDARPAGGKRPGVENVSGRHNVLGGDILSSVWSTILDESFFPGHAGPGVPHSTRSAVLLHSGHLATGVLEPSGAHPPPSHAYPHNQEQVAARRRAVPGRCRACCERVTIDWLDRTTARLSGAYPEGLVRLGVIESEFCGPSPLARPRGGWEGVSCALPG